MKAPAQCSQATISALVLGIPTNVSVSSRRMELLKARAKELETLLDYLESSGTDQDAKIIIEYTNRALGDLSKPCPRMPQHSEAEAHDLDDSDFGLCRVMDLWHCLEENPASASSERDTQNRSKRGCFCNFKAARRPHHSTAVSHAVVAIKRTSDALRNMLAKDEKVVAEHNKMVADSRNTFLEDVLNNEMEMHLSVVELLKESVKVCDPASLPVAQALNYFFAEAGEPTADKNVSRSHASWQQIQDFEDFTKRSHDLASGLNAINAFHSVDTLVKHATSKKGDKRLLSLELLTELMCQPLENLTDDRRHYLHRAILKAFSNQQWSSEDKRPFEDRASWYCRPVLVKLLHDLRRCMRKLDAAEYSLSVGQPNLMERRRHVINIADLGCLGYIEALRVLHQHVLVDHNSWFMRELGYKELRRVLAAPAVGELARDGSHDKMFYTHVVTPLLHTILDKRENRVVRHEAGEAMMEFGRAIPLENRELIKLIQEEAERHMRLSRDPELFRHWSHIEREFGNKSAAAMENNPEVSLHLSRVKQSSLDD